MKEITIEVYHEQFYLREDRFHAFLHQGEGEHKRTIGLAHDVRPNDYFKMIEDLNGIKTRLELLGNTVKTNIKEIPDPNFESQEEADAWDEGRYEELNK